MASLKKIFVKLLPVCHWPDKCVHIVQPIVEPYGKTDRCLDRKTQDHKDSRIDSYIGIGRGRQRDRRTDRYIIDDRKIV